MPIDFFKSGCKKTSIKKEFGLCDNPDPAKDPAYIDEFNDVNWIAQVTNQNGNSVDFFAIDHCIEIRRSNIEMAKHCDGMLSYESNIVFVELKNRGSSGWLSDGRKQLTETISFFKDNHNITTYKLKEAYVCNKQRPLAVTNISSEVQKFKDETAVILKNKGILGKSGHIDHLLPI